MNRELVENILGVIKTSTDKNVIVKGLIKIRTDLVKDQNGVLLFRDAGGVVPMVRFLNKPHEQILEVALSILGNCCTDEKSCKEALECKISMPLVTILKSIPNPIIQCRACRLLGNLAKCDCTQLLAPHYPTLAQSVCQIIMETSDVQTRVMAFRACRFLLSRAEFLKYFLQSDGFVVLLRILAAVMKNDVKEDEQAQNSKGVIAVGLKKNQHREKYFEEVARNLEGVRSDIFDHEVLKNAQPASNAYAMPMEKAALELVCEILKCLLVMSEIQINKSIWESLNRNSSTFAPIVFFIAQDNKYRSVTLKILSNFSKNLGAFYILSNADAIVGACELLVFANNMEKPLTESEIRHCINIICMLSPDACNRSKIRRSGAIRKLIAMLRESQSKTEIASIFHILNNFEYDNMSVDLMLKEGLIPVLITELNVYLSSNDEYHKRKREEKQQVTRKRKLPQQTKVEQKCKFVKIRDEASFIDSDSPSSSPRSYFSPSSPGSSRSMSPVGSSSFKFDDTAADDETYSPVCSDDDDDDDDNDDNNANAHANNTLTASTETNNPNAATTSTTDNSDIMKLLDIACRSEAIEDTMLDKEDDDEISQDAPAAKMPQLESLPRSTIDIIENLLFRVTLRTNKRGELAKPETMHTLIKAINIFGTNNNFAGSLTNILLESQFFAQVIKQGIAHQLFQLTKIEEMRDDAWMILETLTNVGESNYGKAELARLLRCDDASSQKRAAIAVAYIIKSPRLLYQFLNDGNALSILLNIILQNRIDSYTNEAVDALTSMCHNTLGITVPYYDAAKINQEYERYVIRETITTPTPLDYDMRFIVHHFDKTAQYAKDNENANDDETIKLPDAAAVCETAPPVVVAFKKQLLCDNSEVFNTMLNSDFREGHEGEIHIRTYTVNGLKYFLNLIVLQSQSLKFNIPPVNEYYALIEAFEMSRIYIMPSMEQELQNLLIYLLDETNCLSLFEWSIRNYHTELMDMTINYYLCASSITTQSKVELFHKADNCAHSTEWFQMIFDAILTRCLNGV